MTYIRTIGGVGLIAFAAFGLWTGNDTITGYSTWFLVIGFALLAYSLISARYSPANKQWPQDSKEPLPFHIAPIDYLKAFVCWFDAFKRTYTVEPGLYYTGDHYDSSSPILVTSNYHLSVFLVARRARSFNARLLVVDTDGINVWCAAGKGRFSNQEIFKQLNRYDRNLLTDSKKISLILPKVGLSGVNLAELRKQRIRPVIGPLYARDIPLYLAEPPFKDRKKDRINFGLQMRIFTVLPSLVQTFTYSLAIALVLFLIEVFFGLKVPMGLIFITLAAGLMYPLLFPFIPGERFAVKGLWLGAVIGLGLVIAMISGIITSSQLLMGLPFAIGISMFLGLSYTGESAVSNYSRVRREIARFLPINVAFFLVSIVAYIGLGERI